MRVLLFVMAVLAAAGPALAADDKPKARPLVVIAAKPRQTPTRPAISLQPASVASLPPPVQPGAGFNGAGFASGGLAQNGLRSSLPLVGDPAAQCRAICVQARITCDAQDAAPECGSRWGQCTAACAR